MLMLQKYIPNGKLFGVEPWPFNSSRKTWCGCGGESNCADSPSVTSWKGTRDLLDPGLETYRVPANQASGHKRVCVVTRMYTYRFHSGWQRLQYGIGITSKDREAALGYFEMTTLYLLGTIGISAGLAASSESGVQCYIMGCVWDITTLTCGFFLHV